MRIFLDANILFSASLPQSRIRTLVTSALRRVVFLTNAYAVEEARRNIELKSSQNISRLDALVAHCELIPSVILELDVELNWLRKICPFYGARLLEKRHTLSQEIVTTLGRFLEKQFRISKSFRRKCWRKNLRN